MKDPAPAREADQIEGVPLPEACHTMVGHEAVFTTISEQIAARRVPGAYLLHGPRGIGKATLAFAIARRLLAETSDESADRIAEQVAEGVHPNVFVLRKSPKDGRGFYTVIRIDEVRHLRARLQQTRGRAGYRICIVDAIDDCNAAAANALLKTLEEPPADTLFILVSHRPGALLPTIRSRCQAHALRPLSADAVRQVMVDSDAEPALFNEAVKLADGRPRRALELLALGDVQALVDLRAWLADPLAAPAGIQLALADALAAASEPEKAMARELIFDHLAAEARDAAAESGTSEQLRLASATQLWEKARDLFQDADIYNLDARQTLVAIFDAIKQHRQRFAPSLAVHSV